MSAELQKVKNRQGTLKRKVGGFAGPGIQGQGSKTVWRWPSRTEQSALGQEFGAAQWELRRTSPSDRR